MQNKKTDTPLGRMTVLQYKILVACRTSPKLLDTDIAKVVGTSSMHVGRTKRKFKDLLSCQ